MFQSTHPARGATGNLCLRCPVCDEVSIHAPREGCDMRSPSVPTRSLCFNPRTPRGVRRTVSTLVIQLPSSFNPRTPRGVRHTISTVKEVTNMFQSTHPARGATPSLCVACPFSVISIHAPREGCDGRTETETAHERQGAFQSTHPARGATRRRRAPREEEGISIHAPREGCDKTFLIKRCYNKNFNPRPPRGVRLRQPSRIPR